MQGNPEKARNNLGWNCKVKFHVNNILSQKTNENIIHIKNLHHEQYSTSFLYEKLGDITNDIYPFIIDGIEIDNDNRFNTKKIFILPKYISN